MRNGKQLQTVHETWLQDVCAQLDDLTTSYSKLNDQRISYFKEFLHEQAKRHVPVNSGLSPEEFTRAFLQSSFEQGEAMGSVLINECEQGLSFFQQALQQMVANYQNMQTESIKYFNFCLGLLPTPGGFKLDDTIKTNWLQSREAVAAYQEFMLGNLQLLQQQLASFKKTKE